jgi:hypothetical protein
MLLTLNDRDFSWPEGAHHSKAIVTITIGAAYQNIWNDACKKSWAAYAEKYGYDIIVISHHLDESERGRGRSPAWQKLLILDQPWAQRYERIVWVDADIVFSDMALDILDAVPDPRKVGISLSSDQLSLDERQIYTERILKTRYGIVDAELLWKFVQQNSFSKHGVPWDDGIMFNTGVMVLSPREHNGLFRRIYEYEDRGRLYEQPALSYVLVSEKAFHRISARFNWGVFEFLIMQFPEFLGKDSSVDEVAGIMPHLLNELDKAYFLHFSGCPSVLQGYATITKSTRA